MKPTKPIRLLAAGIAGLSLAGCANLSNLFDGEDRKPVAEPRIGERPRVAQAQPIPPQPQVRAEPLRQQARAEPQYPPKAASQELVRNVQKELQSAGINPGPIDGIWGPRTAQAVRQYQQKNDLETTGQLNAPTLASLGIADQEARTAMGEQGAAAGGTQQQQGARMQQDKQKQQQAQQRQGQQPGAFAKADEDDDARLDREEFRDAVRMREQQAGQQAGAAAGGTGGSAAAGATAKGDYSKDVVMKVQKTLNDKGFDAGAVDGTVGETTRRALQNFQQAQGMEASGELNQQTLSALGIEQNAK